MPFLLSVFFIEKTSREFCSVESYPDHHAGFLNREMTAVMVTTCIRPENLPREISHLYGD
jgi:hypothetical protein